MSRVRTFLLVQIFGFGAASLVHAGVLADGFQHRQASIAEGVIAGVLLLGLAIGMAGPALARAAALAAQAFALLGTFVGITMIAIGVGPQSTFDILLHVCFVTLLVAGLLTARRAPRTGGRSMSPSHA